MISYLDSEAASLYQRSVFLFQYSTNEIMVAIIWAKAFNGQLPQPLWIPEIGVVKMTSADMCGHIDHALEAHTLQLSC